MEVRNQAMEQMLVNTAAQPAESRGARQASGSDKPDFETMVRRKHAETGKPEAKKAKPETAKGEVKETAQTDAVQAEPAQELTAEPAYVMSAAMLVQAQPQVQVTVVPAEETVSPTSVAAPDVNNEAETAYVPELAAAAPQAAEQTVADIAQYPVQEAAAEDAQPAQAEPQQVRPVKAPEARPDAEEAAPTEVKDEPEPIRAPERPEEAPQADRRTEAPRMLRTEAVRDEDETEAELDTPILPQDAEAAAPVRTEQPVRIAETPVFLEAPDAPEQLELELAESMQVNSAEPNRVEITLTPEHLGKLTVEIARNENGVLSVVLHPSTMRAAHLLERSTASLQNLLAGNAGSEVEVRVRPNEEQQLLDPNGQQQRQQQQQQQNENGRRNRHTNAQEFLQQLRLGLVEME